MVLPSSLMVFLQWMTFLKTSNTLDENSSYVNWRNTLNKNLGNIDECRDIRYCPIRSITREQRARQVGLEK